jgi:hypothetical protein
MVCFSANPHHLRRRECRRFSAKVSITTNTRCTRNASAVLCRNPLLSIAARTTALAHNRSGANSLADSRIPALALTSRFRRAVEQPLHARGRSTPMRSLPMKPLGLNLAIPSAVRSGFAIRYLPGLHRQPLGATLRVFKATRHPHLGPIPWLQANRFRAIFQVLFCRGPMLRAHALWAASARGAPIRSGRGANGASPAAANNAATRRAWPVPSSTINVPPGANSAGAAATIAR